MKSNNKVTNALGWKLLERFGVQGTQFVLQIILARILDPEHYGVLSMMVIFTNLANIFIQNGFNTALIQDKDVTEEDYSSVFWVTFGVAIILYGCLFMAAPIIASFYQMPSIVQPFRVLSLILFPGALNSIQLAKVNRELDFRKVFYSNILAIIVAGIVGVIMALYGGGIWALVIQSMLNVVIACAVMMFTVKWRTHFVCNLKRVKKLFSYGWKLLVSGLLETIYQDVRSLVIGKKYDSSTLGYYNRGKQFPQFIISAVNSTVQSVMLPVIAAEQDDKIKVKTITRNSIMLSAYIIFPIMAGLAGVATPMVSILLTDKWLPCVPFLQIYCFALAFNPIHTCNLQAINAMGRSDIFLKLELIKKSYGLLTLIIAVLFFDSPIAIAMTGVVTAFISCFVNAFPNKKLIGYSYKEQMTDIIPSLVLTFVMLAVVLLVGQLKFNAIVTLVVQVCSGVVTYAGLSAIFKMKPFMVIIQALMKKNMLLKN